MYRYRLTTFGKAVPDANLSHKTTKGPEDRKRLRGLHLFFCLAEGALSFGLLGLAALHGNRDVGHGGGVGGAVPVANAIEVMNRHNLEGGAL